MSGSMRLAWEYFGVELWEPLADYTTKDAKAPPDLFSDLFAEANDYLGVPLDEKGPRFLSIRNDATIARTEFFSLQGTDFFSEGAIVTFLEEAHDVISDYEIPGFDDLYRRLIRDAVRKFNLRYRLDDPFALRFMLPGSFTNLYGELQRLNRGNVHLSGLWSDFEAAFDRYARTLSDSDLRISIAKVSNYLEGLASATNGKTDTLGKLCDSLTDWPHNKVKDAVKSLYTFCSDYPGIRHSGTVGNQKRQLDARDSVAINVSLLALAAYLGNGLDHGAVLGAGPGSATRTRVISASSGAPRRASWLKRLFRRVGVQLQ